MFLFYQMSMAIMNPKGLKPDFVINGEQLYTQPEIAANVPDGLIALSIFWLALSFCAMMII